MTNRLGALLGLASLLLLMPAWAQHEPAGEHAAAAEHGEEHAEPVSELAIEHGSWFYGIAGWVNETIFGGARVVSGYIFVSWFVILLLVGLAARATAGMRADPAATGPPHGLQNFFEMTVEGLTNFVVGILGPHGARYAPLCGTFFIYILANNWIAVVPGFVAPTSTLNMTLALGLTAFCSVQYFAIRENGLKGYLYHFAGSPKDVLGWGLALLMFPLEVIGELVKPLSLSMRLFGNIFGEDTVVIQIALFTLGLGGWKIVNHHVEQAGALWVGVVPLHLPMMAFSLFGGLIQALVFTMLVSIYISLLTSHDHDAEHGEAHGH